jgi:hypothetical protein
MIRLLAVVCSGQSHLERWNRVLAVMAGRASEGCPGCLRTNGPGVDGRAGTRPIGIGKRAQLGIGFRILVIPGRDPGIASTDGVRLDPRIRSGDDEDEAVYPGTGADDGPAPAMTGLSDGAAFEAAFIDRHSSFR